jgi:hypothetical protein
MPATGDRLSTLGPWQCRNSSGMFAERLQVRHLRVGASYPPQAQAAAAIGRVELLERPHWRNVRDAIAEEVQSPHLAVMDLGIDLAADPGGFSSGGGARRPRPAPRPRTFPTAQAPANGRPGLADEALPGRTGGGQRWGQRLYGDDRRNLASGKNPLDPVTSSYENGADRLPRFRGILSPVLNLPRGTHGDA